LINEDLLKKVIIEQQSLLATGEELWHREYASDILPLLEYQHIIVITGIRRCGKSYLLKIIKNITSANEQLPDGNFLYLNFEDERLAKLEPEDLSGLIDLYFRLLKPDFNKKVFLLFDEIQNVPQWHRWLNRLYEQKRFKIVITGSNASLLKEETGKLLTGRSISLEMLPLSFKEFFYYFQKELKMEEKDFYDSQRRAALMNSFDRYLQSGGFPEYLKTGNYLILQEYFKDIIQRDIIYRYSIRYKKELKEMAKIIISGPGNILSLNNIARAVEMKNIGTVKNYIAYLNESYLVFGIPLFSPSIKKQVYNPDKFYSVDQGLYRAVSFRVSENLGPIIENMVFLHLKRKVKTGDSLFYYKTRSGKEIDFVIFFEGNARLFQVCWDITEKNTLEREKQAVLEAAKEFGIREGTIITGNRKDQIKEGDITISIIPAAEFLLSDSLENPGY
jgi:predicted AAA+ superfamily ATPase